MADKVYEFRKLNASDIFPMARLLSKIGIQELALCLDTPAIKAAIGEMFAEDGEKGGSDDSAVAAVGIQVALNVGGTILANLSECENEVFGILARVSNLKEKQIRELDMGTFAEMIIDFVKKPEFTDFFTAVTKLLKVKQVS